MQKRLSYHEFFNFEVNQMTWKFGPGFSIAIYSANTKDFQTKLVSSLTKQTFFKPLVTSARYWF